MVKVAVIGGGISGLACARRLQQLGTEAVVFDTGKQHRGALQQGGGLAAGPRRNI